MEVEGKLLGMPTMFIARVVPEFEKLERFSHYFLTEDFHVFDWAMRHLVPLNVPITVGRFPRDIDLYLASPLAAYSTMMVRQEAPWADKLRPQDQVSLVIAPYTLVTFARHAGVPTIPNDYLGDRVP